MLSSPNSTVNETVLVPEMEPIVPDLCMEQLWSEPVPAGCQRYLPTLNLTKNRHRACSGPSNEWNYYSIITIIHLNAILALPVDVDFLYLGIFSNLRLLGCGLS